MSLNHKIGQNTPYRGVILLLRRGLCQDEGVYKLPRDLNKTLSLLNSDVRICDMIYSAIYLVFFIHRELSDRSMLRGIRGASVLHLKTCFCQICTELLSVHNSARYQRKFEPLFSE